MNSHTSIDSMGYSILKTWYILKQISNAFDEENTTYLMLSK